MRWPSSVRRELEVAAAEMSAIGFEMMWSDLARYNAEKSRGIVHTEEWKAKMAEKQARYVEWARKNL